jgi:hypothetical protein
LARVCLEVCCSISLYFLVSRLVRLGIVMQLHLLKHSLQKLGALDYLNDRRNSCLFVVSDYTVPLLVLVFFLCWVLWAGIDALRQLDLRLQTSRRHQHTCCFVANLSREPVAAVCLWCPTCMQTANQEEVLTGRYLISVW